MNSSTNIYLVGLMGAGKTTVGKQLARLLGWPFMDSDHEIEARTGVRIPTIFEIEGEEGFRRREVQTIAELCHEKGVVLATGGGVVIHPDNRRALRESGWVVYLNVPPKLLYDRARHDKNRPLLQVDNPLGKLLELHGQRDPLYRETAHLVVDGTHQAPLNVTQFIYKEFTARCAP